MANNYDQVAVALDLDAQDTEPVVGVMEGNPLDQAVKRFQFGALRWAGID